ncbi:MAG TPA: amidohydrolase family protein [Xanthobacteraceae bacterium]|nr:amidohydrolase family protein [Xanthobacteraceae bacterium]
MHRIKIATFTATMALGVLTGLADRASAQGVTAYEGARVIVGDGRVLDNTTLVVSGTKITQIGGTVPAGATRVSLAGKTVMPMFLDTHTHLSTTRDKLVADLRQRAYFGVGAALSLGTDNYELLDLRNKDNPGMARFFSAGKGISRTEGRPTLEINSVEEARKAVRTNVGYNVDIIKVWVDDRDGKFDKVLPSQYEAIIDEAHKNGLRVTAHIFNEIDGKRLIRAGIDAFAHSVRDKDIDDEMLALYKSKPNLVVNPNLPDRGIKQDLSWLKPSLAPTDYAKLEEGNTDRPKAQEFYGIQSRNLAKINAAGVKIVLGTDGNRAWAPHEEAADMVAAGMTPMQVIIAATKNAAEFLKMSDTGTLEAGKNADFIVLDANPLDDITNTRKISQVILRGAAVDRSKLPN